MIRDILNAFLAWKQAKEHLPIILRGARQVGKSWLVREFGKHFDDFAEINFDQDERAGHLFDGDLKIATLLERLSLYCEKKITPGKTLLFLDEVQECENAIKALRYFKEDCPELHVVAAGSLIDFALEKISVPVGRVQFFYLYPLSFGEFLTANNHDELRRHIHPNKPDAVLHAKILEHLKNYMWLGGMPAVVDHWIKNRDAVHCQKLQTQIITAYKQDFSKYARRQQIDYVTTLFEAVPQQLGDKFKFSNVEQNVRAAALKQALLLLEMAGIVYRCFHSSGQALPLGATKDEKKFKVFFFDIGLTQRLLGLKLKEWSTLPLEVGHLGAMAEQLVAQEYVAYSDCSMPPQLYYWHRESPGSNAEVDFLFVSDQGIVPVEVKSGVKGGMKSLGSFLESHDHAKFGLKIAQGDFCRSETLHEIPLYGLEAWLKLSSNL